MRTDSSYLPTKTIASAEVTGVRKAYPLHNAHYIQRTAGRAVGKPIYSAECTRPET